MPPLLSYQNNCYHPCSMPTDHIVTLLVAERDKLSRAIEALQGTVKRIGRPPKNSMLPIATPIAEASASAEPKQRTPRSEEQREAHAQRMREYWAKRKKAEKRASKS